MTPWSALRVAPDSSHHVDEAGLPAYPSRFLEVLTFHVPGLAPVRDPSGAFHIRPDGVAAYGDRFRRTFGFYEERAAVDAGEWLHVLPSGAPAYSERFEWCGNFQEGLCAVRTHPGLAHHIRADGSPAYRGRFSYVGDYREGVAVARRFEDGRCLHIDRSGAVLHGGRFLDLDVFHKGFARARDEDGWFHVRRDGSAAYSLRFRAVEPFYNGVALCETALDGRILVSEDGQVVRQLAKTHPVLRAREGDDSLPEPFLPWQTLVGLGLVPRAVGAALLIRHSIRAHIPPGVDGDEVELTERGRRLAEAFGRLLVDRLGEVRSSTSPRCIQTGESIALGAGQRRESRVDPTLGPLGPFTLDRELSRPLREEIGHAGIYERMLRAPDVPLPGRRTLREGARLLALTMLGKDIPTGAVNVHVTHDTTLFAFALAMTGATTVSNSDWPQMLEGLFLWKVGPHTHVAWKGRVQRAAWSFE